MAFCNCKDHIIIMKGEDAVDAFACLQPMTSLPMATRPSPSRLILTLFNSWTSPFKVCFWRFFDLHQNQTGINGCSSPGSLSSSFHYSLRSKSLVMESGCLFFSATPIWRSVTFCGHGWLEEEQMVWDQLSETETRQRDEKFASKESYDLLLSCEICWMIVTMNCKRSTITHMVGKVRWYCKPRTYLEKKRNRNQLGCFQWEYVFQHLPICLALGPSSVFWRKRSHMESVGDTADDITTHWHQMTSDAYKPGDVANFKLILNQVT